MLDNIYGKDSIDNFKISVDFYFNWDICYGGIKILFFVYEVRG
jgi:hypothetical protein